ncbi:MAG: NAD(P)-dependent oxidoreductase [Natronospirillum sp.]
MQPNHAHTIAFIGFGEAAQAFISQMDRSRMHSVRAFDLKLLGDDAATVQAACAQYDVTACATLAEALYGADIVWSLVTADQAHTAARSAAAELVPDAWFFDCNSCAPHTKQDSAALIEQASGRYVDVAVMSPVLPARNRTPLLLSGPHADEASVLLNAMAMNASVESGPVGTSSAVKMVRSIMVKGLEALFAECTLAGRLAGVDQQVFASLEASNPGFNWTERAAYNLERMTLHGERRAAEMEEVCAFLRHLGLPERMSETTVRWQRRLAQSGVKASADDYTAPTDALLKHFNLPNDQEITR